MTPTEQAARWLADVERFTPPYTNGNWIKEADALAAIASHLAPGNDLAAHATTALEGVTPLTGWLRNPWSKSDSVERGPIPEWLAALLFEAAGKIETSSDTITALLARISALTAKVAESRISEPHDPGDFVGDIYYGHPVKTTMGTHRWTGSEWIELPSEAEALAGLLAEARNENATLRDRLARMEGALRHEVKRGRRHLAASTLAILAEADAALTDGGSNG